MINYQLVLKYSQRRENTLDFSSLNSLLNKNTLLCFSPSVSSCCSFEMQVHLFLVKFYFLFTIPYACLWIQLLNLWNINMILKFRIFKVTILREMSCPHNSCSPILSSSLPLSPLSAISTIITLVSDACMLYKWTNVWVFWWNGKGTVHFLPGFGLSLLNQLELFSWGGGADAWVA